MTRSELIKNWYEKEENILSICKNDTIGELIVGFCDYGTIDISYILNLGGNHNISVDKRMELEEGDSDNEELIYETKDVEKLMLELLTNIFATASLRECKISTSPRQIDNAIKRILNDSYNEGSASRPGYSISADELKSFLIEALDLD